jgi:amidase
VNREMGIRELQRAMNAGEVTAQQLVERYQYRIDAIDRDGPRLNSILERNPDAMAIAEMLDEERARGKTRGPLHGIPLILKGNIDTADRMTTTAGSLAMAGSMPAQDAFLVSRLREAGAVILGKANLSEWANFRGKNSLSGWSSQGGQTRNPYDTNRSPCGSSSGSAVAVSADLCTAALGTETDGSIVCPAQTCGIVGIKPTIGLVSRSGIIPVAHSQDTAGPMARTVEDAAIVLDAVTGVDPRDPVTQAIRSRCDADYARHLDPDGLRGARIGVARNFFDVHRGVDRLMDSCLDALRELGATLVDPANIETAGKWRESEMLVLLYEFKHDLNAYLASRGSAVPVRSLAEVIAFNELHADDVMPHFGQELMELAQEKGELTEKAYLEALDANLRLSRGEGIDGTLRKHELDAIVAPTGGPAWLIDTVHGDYGISGCSSPPAVAGYPHVTVPAGYVERLPIGLSFFGGAWEERRLIRLAHAFEFATQARCRPCFGE